MNFRFFYCEFKEAISLAAVIVILNSLQIHAQGLSKNPDASQGTKLFESGIAKYKAGDYKGALQDFETALSYDKSNSLVYRWKGDSEQNLNQFSQSILSYSKAIAMAERDTLSYKGRAFSFAMMGKFEESLKDYNKGIELNPNDDDMYFGRATSYYKTHQYKKSIDDFNLVIKRHPKFELTFIKRAISYIELEQYLEAKKDIKRYFQLGGRDDAAYYFRGLVNTRLGSGKPLLLDSAIADLIRYTLSKDEAKRKDPMAFQTLGIAYSKKGDSINSRMNFRKSIEFGPANANTYFRWGSCELSFNNPKKANELLSKARGMTDSPSAAFLVNYGAAKAGIGDTTGAVNNFAEALKQDTSLYEAYERRAAFLFDNRKYAQTVLGDFQHMINLTGEDNAKAELHSYKSMVAMHISDTLTAKQEVEKAIRLMPGEPFHYMVRAFMNADLGKGQSVVLDDVDRALALDPGMGEAYVFRATYLASLGKHSEACGWIEIVIKEGYNIPKETQDYICKGKKPKNGKVPELFIPASPGQDKKMQRDMSPED